MCLYAPEVLRQLVFICLYDSMYTCTSGLRRDFKYESQSLEYRIVEILLFCLLHTGR